MRAVLAELKTWSGELSPTFNLPATAFGPTEPVASAIPVATVSRDVFEVVGEIDELHELAFMPGGERRKLTPEQKSELRRRGSFKVPSNR